jgi:hypothetical protein
MRKFHLILLQLAICCHAGLLKAAEHKGQLHEPQNFKNIALISEDSTDVEKKNNFKISTTGGNNLIQKGKKSQKQQYYLTPTLGYSHKSGLYANLSTTYLANQGKKPWDDVSIGTGYGHSFGDHFSMDADYSYGHYFSSKQVSSSEANSLTLSISWSGNILTPTLSANYSFGEVKDITYDLGLSHSFDFTGIFGKTDALSIPVNFGSSAGTSNFYQNYVKKNSIKKKNGTTVSPNEINTSFRLTSVSFGTGITYTNHHLSYVFTINYTESTNNVSNIVLNKIPEITIGFVYSI